MIKAINKPSNPYKKKEMADTIDSLLYEVYFNVFPGIVVLGGTTDS